MLAVRLKTNHLPSWRALSTKRVQCGNLDDCLEWRFCNASAGQLYIKQVLFYKLFQIEGVHFYQDLLIDFFFSNFFLKLCQKMWKIIFNLYFQILLLKKWIRSNPSHLSIIKMLMQSGAAASINSSSHWNPLPHWLRQFYGVL